MATVIMAKHFQSLRPIDEAGEEVLRHLKTGDLVKVDVKRPRNVKFFRMFWVMMTLVHRNLSDELADEYPTVETLVAAFKISTGHRDVVALPTGQKVYIPKSISWAKMTEDEFSQFYDRCADIIAKHYLPGVTSDNLKAEVESLIGIRSAA